MLFPPLHEAQFLTRLNRFAAMVLLEGKRVKVHIPNSGRMNELFQPGNSCYLFHRPGEHRKTAYDLGLVDIGTILENPVANPKDNYMFGHMASVQQKRSMHTLVSTDSRVPNILVWESWNAGVLPHFEGYTTGRREVSFHDSRLDMMLVGPTGQCYIEMKSVTLVIDRTAWFPDAPTDRGRKHIETLIRAVKEGHRAAVIFVIQRSDASCLSPYDAHDPEFGAVLRKAARVGVEIYAFTCTLTQQEIIIACEVPVLL
tara:strand:+ start:62 stop:832 length:771 start_codon:yes stop_codon:yes gene_type:complete